jgi:hypothetical protein
VAKLALKKFSANDNCAEFLDYAATALTEQYLQPFYRCYGDSLIACPVFIGAAEGDAVSGAPMASNAPGEVPGRVSGTNTQEAGVDEADIVKTDAAGNLYVLSGQHLLVVDAFPPAGLADRPLADFNLTGGDPNFYASDLFLDEAAHRLVVLGQTYNLSGGESVQVIVDISDPAQPVELLRLEVSGYALQSRRIGSRVHRVSRFDVPPPGWFHDQADTLNQSRIEYFDAQSRGDEAAQTSIRAATRAEIRNRLNASGADPLLPRLRNGTNTTTLDCSAVAGPDVPEGLGLAIIDSFNTDGSGRATAAAVNNAYLVYASSDNLYLAQSSFGWRFAPDQAEETAIYRFALGSSGPADYQGLGKVAGSVNNAYSFSEFDGHLRVASTETRLSETPDGTRASTFNHLHVLRANQPQTDLSLSGSARDFAPGERIQGTRFVGSRGYIVTFRQIDPLFAFDLSNPAQPRIASELKIPGFSSYLAPVGDDYLLTAGREGEDTGLTGRMQISLFDVRNLANVQQIATLVPASQPDSYSYSAAEYDPHAFTYFPDQAAAASPGILALPLQIFGNAPEQQFAGFLAVRVDPTAANPLTELGRIDHKSLADHDQFCGVEGPDVCFDAVYGAEPRRAAFMTDGPETYLYTVSAVGVIASDAGDPQQVLGQKELPYDPATACCVSGGGGTEPAQSGP